MSRGLHNPDDNLRFQRLMLAGLVVGSLSMVACSALGQPARKPSFHFDPAPGALVPMAYFCPTEHAAEDLLAAQVQLPSTVFARTPSCAYLPAEEGRMHFVGPYRVTKVGKIDKGRDGTMYAVVEVELPKPRQHPTAQAHRVWTITPHFVLGEGA